MYTLDGCWFARQGNVGVDDPRKLVYERAQLENLGGVKGASLFNIGQVGVMNLGHGYEGSPESRCQSTYAFQWDQAQSQELSLQVIPFPVLLVASVESWRIYFCQG